MSPDSPSQVLAQPEPNHRLKAVGYALAGALAALAILVASIALTFLGGGFLISSFVQGSSYEGFILWLNHTTAASLIVGPLLSIYPIMKISGPLFAQAKANWNN